MANPEQEPVPETKTDSLNCDFFEVTVANSVTDTTVRPMRDSLRKRLGLPPNGQQSPEPPKDDPRA